MKPTLVLGVDCGGTHTDAALLEVDKVEKTARLIASAKTATLHDNLPHSIGEVLKELSEQPETPKEMLRKAARLTLGTTLAVNALVQGKADKVALVLTAGPGLDPVHFAMGEHVCIVPGGLDHRGAEVKPLYTEELKRQASRWPGEGVAAVACVGKFSPRNPAHENELGLIASRISGLPVTLGHKLSGRLNFPRRMATAWYNASVTRVQNNFLDAAETAFKNFGLRGQPRLLKADGGAIPFAAARTEPVQSILSGPAASVMGVLAMWTPPSAECSLLLDIGGTTTDLALFLDGSPVVDRQGMKLLGRRTLIRSIAAASIGIGGDSLLHYAKDRGKLLVGPQREGPAMAFGGQLPTLLDALNFLDGDEDDRDAGDIDASRKGIRALAAELNMSSEDLAREAVAQALKEIGRAIYNLVAQINDKPIYTLAALKAAREARPTRACLVGGPAACLRKRLEEALGMPVEMPPYPQVANAIGAALTLPTASLEVYADTGSGFLTAPALDYRERIPRSFDLEQTAAKAIGLLEQRLQEDGMEENAVEVVEKDFFATLDAQGRSARDMRVAVQARPGVAGRVVNRR